MIRPEVKSEAIRLRVEERMSLKGIAQNLGISKATCSVLLRKYRLSAEECEERYRNSGLATKGSRRKDRGELSKHFCEITDSNQKGRIAEAAVGFRLAVQGFEFYRADVSSAKYDFVVEYQDKLVRIQVKWANMNYKGGLPVANLRCSDGRKISRRYRSGEFDILAAYNFYTDTVYVFHAAEVIHKTAVAIRMECAEAWSKLSGK